MAPKAFRTEFNVLACGSRTLRYLLPLTSSSSPSQASAAPMETLLQLGLEVSSTCTSRYFWGTNSPSSALSSRGHTWSLSP